MAPAPPAIRGAGGWLNPRDWERGRRKSTAAVSEDCPARRREVPRCQGGELRCSTVRGRTHGRLRLRAWRRRPRSPGSHGRSCWQRSRLRAGGGRGQEASAAPLRARRPGERAAARAGTRPSLRRKIGQKGPREAAGRRATRRQRRGLKWVREYFGKVWRTGGSR